MSDVTATSTRRRAVGLDAATLARLARRTPQPLMRAAVAGPGRGAVIAQVFRRMPAQLKPSATTTDAVIRWDIADERRRTETWFLVFEDGRCLTTRRLDESIQPRTTFTVGAYDFLRLASGAENPMQMFQSGRIRISGDLFFAAQLQSLFRIPS